MDVFYAFLWYPIGSKAGNRLDSIRISAYPDTSRHVSLILLILILASLSISRTIERMLTSGVTIPHGMTPALRHGTCGIRAPTVPSASHRGGCMILPRALLAKSSWPTCGKTRRLPPWHVRHGSSGIGLW